MCGIVGFTGEKSSEILERMTRSIHHRGPDDGVLVEVDNFNIGYRRLAIIDLSKNIYPIKNEFDELELVLNGEIYNYKELKKELVRLGHKFKTESDSETIVHGYEEWGENVLDRLRGMFVFVLLDKRTNTMFIARDRLGIKPLYYAEFDGRIVFSSEIKALFTGFNIPREPDDRAIYDFLVSRIHDTNKNTFFKNVKRLLPGHKMVVDSEGNFRIEKYWNPKLNLEFSSTKSDEDYAEEFKDILNKAVSLHLISDVPVGVTLSGGLDSSGITALSAELYKQKRENSKMIAFSAIHPGETINEEEYIDSVVSHTNVESVKIKPELEKFWEELENWVYFQEEPVISGAPYAYYTVMREARKRVTVLLSGQGGDELLAGYIPYFLTYAKSAINDGRYFTALKESYLGRDLYLPFVLDKLKSKFGKLSEIDSKYCLKNSFSKNYSILNQDFRHKDNLNERLFDDVTRSTTPCLLRYEDKNSMANSLESRVPFFDHVVVEYIFNLPMDQKIKNGWNRYIYRNAMKGIIPEKNRLRRSKVGFTNPEWEWIERKKDKFVEIFSSQSFKERKYWDSNRTLEYFEKALEKQLSGDIMYFWRLFIVEMWMRVYVDDFKSR